MVLSQCPPQKTNVCFRFTWNVSFRGSDLLKAMMFNEFFGTQTAIGGQVNLSDPHIYLQHLQFGLFCHSKKGKTGILEQGNKALRIQIRSNHHEMTQIIQVQWTVVCHVKQKSSKPQILHCGSRSSVRGTARAAGVELLWPKAAESASLSARWLTGKPHRETQHFWKSQHFKCKKDNLKKMLRCFPCGKSCCSFYLH